MIMNFLDTIIGQLPAYSSQQVNPAEYYAIIRYMIAGVVLLFELALVYKLLSSIFGGWLK